MPLKFGPETTTRVTVARVRLEVAAADGRRAEGWGETPLSVQWVWPSEESYEERHQALVAFTAGLGPRLERLRGQRSRPGGGTRLPGSTCRRSWTASATGPSRCRCWRRGCAAPPSTWPSTTPSAASAAGRSNETYDAGYLNADLSRFLEPEPGVDFAGLYPRDFLAPGPLRRLPAWHLVGGLDPLTPDELTGGEPETATRCCWPTGSAATGSSA